VVVDFFVSRSSNVYMAALDARKAFDRVNHVKLFRLFGVLLNQGVPARLVMVICDWYGKTVCIVKRYNCLSEVCVVKSGIRQGGILSSILFNIYIGVMLRELRYTEGMGVTWVAYLLGTLLLLTILLRYLLHYRI